MIKRNKLVSLLVSLSVFITAETVAAGRPDLVLRALEAGKAQYEAGQLIIRYKSFATTEDRNATRKTVGAQFLRIIGDQKRGRLELVQLPDSIPVADAVKELSSNPLVSYAEPNWTYFHQSTGEDPFAASGTLWGMYGDQTIPKNEYGSHAGEAWANGKTDCSSVWVGIIDEGVMHTHTDLAGNMATNPGEIIGNKIDDDDNGFIDDIFGWDFVNNNNSVFDGVTDDHGTHIAGTIGAIGGNGIGVAGVCWSINIITAKILGSYGGTTADAVDAINYMTDLKVHHGIDLVATNNAWGGGGYAHSLYEAIERANSVDILFVTAAGNNQNNCDNSFDCFPAEYINDNIIAVAAVSSSGGAYTLTNFGATTIDIGAPGSGIISTVPRRNPRGRITSSYASYSGTSMAAAHITGAAALFKAQNPEASALNIKSAILDAATPTAALKGKTATGARLNASDF